MDNHTAAMLGELTGLILACLPAYLIGLVVGLFFKTKEPEERAMVAAAGAFIGMYALAGLGYANGAGFRPDAGLLYVPAAVIAFFMLRHHYRRAWRDDEQDA